MKESLKDYTLLDLISLKAHLQKDIKRIDEKMFLNTNTALEQELNRWGEALHTVKLEIDKRL